jgi:hypothetical protein
MHGRFEGHDFVQRLGDGNFVMEECEGGHNFGDGAIRGREDQACLAIYCSGPVARRAMSECVLLGKRGSACTKGRLQSPFLSH